MHWKQVKWENIRVSIDVQSFAESAIDKLITALELP